MNRQHALAAYGICLFINVCALSLRLCHWTYSHSQIETRQQPVKLAQSS